MKKQLFTAMALVFAYSTHAQAIPEEKLACPKEVRASGAIFKQKDNFISQIAGKWAVPNGFFEAKHFERAIFSTDGFRVESMQIHQDLVLDKEEVKLNAIRCTYTSPQDPSQKLILVKILREK